MTNNEDKSGMYLNSTYSSSVPFAKTKFSTNHSLWVSFLIFLWKLSTKGDLRIADGLTILLDLCLYIRVVSTLPHGLFSIPSTSIPGFAFFEFVADQFH